MNFQELILQLTEIIKRLNKKQKIVIISTLAIVVAIIAFLIVFNAGSSKKGDDGYRTLFDNLSSKDAGLIVQQLEKDKVPYKLPRDGVIEVPEEYVMKQRLVVAQAGLPKDSRVGFELFDKQDFGSTDFDQKVKYLRALEGELSKTIESVTAIHKAAVHIAIPKETVFTEKETPPTASVILTMKQNMVLTKNQTLGVKNLVAASVPKLTAENVKIVNENGDILGEDEDPLLSADAVKQQMRYKKENEAAYEEKILNVLAPVAGGRDRVVAKVSIDYDFSQKQSTSETYDPNNVVRSEQTLEEKREGFRPPEVGGVPGAVSNIGPVEGIGDNKTIEKYSKNQGTTNYEISKTVSNTKGQYATIKRITAAVVVDGKYEPKKDAKGNPAGEGMDYVPLNQTEITGLTSLVKQAIGVSPERGDEVSVSNFMFRSLLPSAESGLKGFINKYAAVITPISGFLKYLLALIILYIVYLKVIVPFSERMMEIPIDEEFKPKEITFDEEELEDTHGKLQEMKKRVEQSLGFGGLMSEDNLKYDVLIEKLKALMEEKPEEAAKLLETLVADEVSVELGGHKKPPGA